MQGHYTIKASFPQENKVILLTKSSQNKIPKAEHIWIGSTLLVKAPGQILTRNGHLAYGYGSGCKFTWSHANIYTPGHNGKKFTTVVMWQKS
jgi:hypothetical protein